MLPERSLIILLLRSTLNLLGQFWRHWGDKTASSIIAGQKLNLVERVVTFKNLRHQDGLQDTKHPPNHTCSREAENPRVSIELHFIFAFKSNLRSSN